MVLAAYPVAGDKANVTLPAAHIGVVEVIEEVIFLGWKVTVVDPNAEQAVTLLIPFPVIVYVLAVSDFKYTTDE